MIGLCLALGAWQDWHWPWFAGVSVAAALFARQLWTCRHRARQSCFRAFLNNNWVGFALFLGVVGETLIP